MQAGKQVGTGWLAGSGRAHWMIASSAATAVWGPPAWGERDHARASRQCWGGQGWFGLASLSATTRPLTTRLLHGHAGGPPAAGLGAKPQLGRFQLHRPRRQARPPPRLRQRPQQPQAALQRGAVGGRDGVVPRPRRPPVGNVLGLGVLQLVAGPAARGGRAQQSSGCVAASRPGHPCAWRSTTGGPARRPASRQPARRARPPTGSWCAQTRCPAPPGCRRPASTARSPRSGLLGGRGVAGARDAWGVRVGGVMSKCRSALWGPLRPGAAAELPRPVDTLPPAPPPSKRTCPPRSEHSAPCRPPSTQASGRTCPPRSEHSAPCLPPTPQASARTLPAPQRAKVLGQQRRQHVQAAVDWGRGGGAAGEGAREPRRELVPQPRRAAPGRRPRASLHPPAGPPRCAQNPAHPSTRWCSAPRPRRPAGRPAGWGWRQWRQQRAGCCPAERGLSFGSRHAQRRSTPQHTAAESRPTRPSCRASNQTE